MWFRVSRVRTPLPTPRNRGLGVIPIPVDFAPILGCSVMVTHQTLTLISWVRIPPSQPYKSSGFAFIFDPLAQLAEHLPFKQGVRSSNLRRVTTSLRTAYRSQRLFMLRMKSHFSLISSQLLPKSQSLTLDCDFVALI